MKIGEIVIVKTNWEKPTYSLNRIKDITKTLIILEHPFAYGGNEIHRDSLTSFDALCMLRYELIQIANTNGVCQ